MTVSELLRIADHLDPPGQLMVRKAFERAATAHHGQRRLSGEDYVNHPLEVAETLDIYAPLAHRLGIGQIKWELEDLAFRNLEPEAYEDVVGRIARKRDEREKLVEDLREILARELEKVGIQAVEITGRPKHIYS